MPNRTAKFASAIFASALAGVAVATIPFGVARAADDCLSAPKNEKPDGSHWYYRLDHANNRQCWYLRKQGEEAMQITPSTAASPAPIAPKAEAAPPRSPPDARAELPPQTRVGPPKRVAWPKPALPARAAAPDIIPPAAVPDASAQSSVLGSRRPEHFDATSVVGPAPADSNFAANVQPAPALPPAIAAVPLIAADAQGRPGSIATLLGVIIGALAVASLIAGLAFKFDRSRQARQRKLRVRRDAIWQRTDDDRSARPYGNVVPRRPRIPRDLDRARDLDRVDDPNERIELLAPLARRAAN